MSEQAEPRESMDFDVVIVGAGPAGLAAAIRLKQRAAETGCEISVCVLEKGLEVGAHILSGAVLDPVALNALIPDWKAKGAPLDTEVTQERFLVLTEKHSFAVPQFLLPPLMRNHGMQIASLANVCRWLGQQAEDLGVEIYPGFAATEILYGADGAVGGVLSGDFGIAKDGHHKSNYTQGMALRGKYTLFAEGARGSLSKQLLARFGLAEACEPQMFGIGLKELWELPQAKHQRGLVLHTMGWPLDNATGGGLFMYHFGERLCAIGMVLHLDYANPYLSPFEEFQRAKQHPAIRSYLEGAERVGYGARAVTEGGWQSVPQLSFAGGALIGCAAGFMNVPRIKGAHHAMSSGMLAADAAFAAIQEERAGDRLEAYDAAYRASAVFEDLRRVRNVKPLWSKFGTIWGVALGGLDLWMQEIFGFSLLGTVHHSKPDCASLTPAKLVQPIAYPRPDGTVAFDKPSSLFLSGTNHEDDQPVHLHLADPTVPLRVNLPTYAEPSQRYCPAGVSEVVADADGERFQINAQNCLHCKVCDIKDPACNITWVPPEGGGGPLYGGM